MHAVNSPGQIASAINLVPTGRAPQLAVRHSHMMIAQRFAKHGRALFGTILSLCLISLFAVRAASAAEPDHGELRVIPFGSNDSVVMTWRGRVGAPMAQQVRHAFEAYKRHSKRIVLKLDSGGGSVKEGERVIGVLRQIKKTHELQTVVSRGKRCGSMCVFIYAQGQRRVGALSSLWLFHEVSHTNARTKTIVRLDRPAWERLVDEYLRSAGVSAEWIAEMKPFTVKSDYWQTGADLVNAKSGVIHVALGNQQARTVDAPEARPKKVNSPTPSQRESGERRGSATECKKYIANIGAVVSVPCE
jgi:ATP-dependent protease ClpP protease subunit